MYRRPSRLIIPQYEAQPYISLIAAAELLGEGRRAIAAQVVDLAVRKVISIGRPTGKRKRSGFTITVVGEAAAENPDERAVLAALFGNQLPVVGQSMQVAPGRNRELGVILQHPHRLAAARLVAADLAREKSLFVKIFQPWRKQPVVPTERAYPIVDHLWGMHDYIELAEKHRFAMLQSPEGAERATLGELDVLKLYERLLPYAVLFGLEKQWMLELDLRMRELSPDALGSLAELVDISWAASTAAQLAVELVDFGDLLNVADVVSASDALEGVGAIFGGIAEFIGDLAG